ncbi:unnamed protein product [Parnassius mnemosyne]|uniref:DDE-1 domain-containing protein n=1 Tax=Parnassius mnemosyne TaxID=213953 RepID=A0AAV1L7Z8_9NEOP
MFMDWFTTIVIPWAQRLEGPKLVIGDKLSSHINVDVVELCERHNIRFVLLQPNSTHLTQPLDVAFFAPLKRTWRKILMKYKIENPKQTSLNKIHFPILLKQLIEEVNLNKADNLISGFRATGIFPYNPQKVYSKIPEYCEEITYDVDKSLLDYLKENRNPNPIRRNTNKKMNVAAGKSVTSWDINKNVTKKNTKSKTSEITSERNFIANSGEEVVQNDIPEKKRSKITILSDIRIPPKTDKNKKTPTKKIKEAKAGPSGITIKRNLQNAWPSVLKAILKKDVKRKGTRTKKLHDNSSDSESDCSVQYADSSDYDSIEDMQDYLLRQLTEDQKMEEKEKDKQMTELETKGHETESLRTEYDKGKEEWLKQEIEDQIKELEKKGYEIKKLRIESDKRQVKEMVNLYDMDKVEWEVRNIEEQTKELETKGHETESLRSESYERKGQEIKQKMVNEYKMERDLWKDQETVEQIKDLGTKEHKTEKHERKQQIKSLIIENDDKKGLKIKRRRLEETMSEKDTINEQNEKASIAKSLYIGQYILVKFESTKNTNKYYCGLITKISEREGVFAKFMRYKNGGFYWPTVPDTSIVFENDIVQILPNPYKNRRGILYFDVKFKYKLE